MAPQSALWGFDTEGKLWTSITNVARDGTGTGAANLFSVAANYGGIDARKGVSSAHPGGINVAMGDGSARTIGDDIQADAWQAYITRAGADNSAASKHIAENQ